MLDLDRLNRIRLSPQPWTQKLVAGGVLAPNYFALPGVKIELQHRDNLPAHNVIFAMNHTDRFNYWPFQYKLWRQENRFTSTWVKGKYYENRWVGAFMEHTNNLPTVSRGYIITKDFINVIGRHPEQAEYDLLRAVVDGTKQQDQDVLAPLKNTKRNILGVDFDPTRGSYADGINNTFNRMMARFVELNAKTFELGLDLLVFPQGTRSIRLTRGHIGMAQIALRYNKVIVPVGCSGSDKVYPGSSPFAKKGHIIYRIGKPITEADHNFTIDEDYAPFTTEAEHTHRTKFEGLTNLVMDSINDLVDPPYRYAVDKEHTDVRGTARFV